MTKALLPRIARLAIALCATLTATAHAGLVSYTSQSYAMGKDYGGPNRLQYQRFDTDLGLLREVRLTYDLSLHHTMLYSNLGDDEQRLTVRYGGSMEFRTPGYWSAGNEKWEYVDVAAHTSQSSIERSWSTQRSFSLTQDLAAFIGDTPGWLDYSLRFYGDGYVPMGSALGFGSMSSAQVRLRLDYVYDTPPPPVQALPEPASLALVLGGCAAAGVVRRRRLHAGR